MHYPDERGFVYAKMVVVAVKKFSRVDLSVVARQKVPLDGRLTAAHRTVAACLKRIRRLTVSEPQAALLTTFNFDASV